MRRNQLFAASGYCSIFAPSLLLILGSGPLRCPWLSFCVFMLIAPLLRRVFGDVKDAPPAWSESAAQCLEALPVLAAALFVFAMLFTAHKLSNSARSLWDLMLLLLSTWTTALFALCFAHELLHRQGAAPRRLGQFASGVIGYPFLATEHRLHHVCAGQTSRPEWPRRDESMWAFSRRRIVYVLKSAREEDRLQTIERAGPWWDGLPLALLGLLSTATWFALSAGGRGLAVYAGSALLATWGMQALTYVQHWGLGDDDPANSGTSIAWEYGCRLQAWLTLGISLHQAHHRSTSTPFYRLQRSLQAPQQPAGYVVLLVASLVPSWWRKLMQPALDRWECASAAPPADSRRPCLRIWSSSRK